MTGCSCSQTGIEGRADARTDAPPDAPPDAAHDLPSDTWHEPTEPDIPWHPGDDCVSPYGWEEVHLPDVCEDETVAELVGGMTRITPDRSGGWPAVVWAGSQWGVAWSRQGHLYALQRLQPDGTPTGEPATFDPDFDTDGDTPGLVWARGSFAAAFKESLDGRTLTAVLDAGGNVLYEPGILAESSDAPDIGIYQAIPGYIATYASTDGDVTTVYAAHIDERGTLTSDARPVGRSTRDYTPGIAAFCEMSSVSYIDEEFNLWQRTFAWPDVEEAPEATRLGSITALHTFTRQEAVPFRDRVVVAWQNLSGPSTLVYSPLTGETLSGPTLVHPVSSDGSASIAPAHEKGFLGLCSQGNRHVEFRLVDPDGKPLGSPLETTPTTEHGYCAVAWSGSEFLIVQWGFTDAGMDDHGLWVQRVRPLI